MANDEEVGDFGGLDGTEPLAEDARAGIREQPASATGAGEDPVSAATPAGEDASAATAPAAEDSAAPAAPSQVVG
jgi:hypothetical protein